MYTSQTYNDILEEDKYDEDDEEEEEKKDDFEVENELFVPHGYLSYKEEDKNEDKKEEGEEPKIEKVGEDGDADTDEGDDKKKSLNKEKNTVDKNMKKMMPLKTKEGIKNPWLNVRTEDGEEIGFWENDIVGCMEPVEPPE